MSPIFLQAASWSSDSVLLICHIGVSTLKIFSIRDGTCIASLKQSTTGNLKHIRWAGDGRTVLYLEPLLVKIVKIVSFFVIQVVFVVFLNLTLSILQFRVAVWKMCDQYGQLGLDYIDSVQPWAKPSFALSPNGKHLAVVSCGIMHSSELSNLNEIEMSKEDHLSIFSAISWRIEKVHVYICSNFHYI